MTQKTTRDTARTWAEISLGSLSMNPMAYRSLRPFQSPAMVQPSPTEMAI